ncbi:unnamed protein product [Ophioblennius macclurei]
MCSQGFSFGDATSRQKFFPPQSSSQMILPCTVSQLLSATKVNQCRFSIHDFELSQVSIVGFIRGFAPFVTYVQYSVDDMTGPPLVVKQWVNTEEPLTAQQCQKKYVKVIGSLRNFSGQRAMLAMDVRVVTDLNEITSHMMEVVRAHVQLSGEMLDVNMNVLDAGGKQDVRPPAHGFPHGLSAVQEQVLEVIRRNSDTRHGLSFNDLKTELNNLKIPDIRMSLTFLLNEGHVFSTIDEHHFKAAEY